MIKTPINQVKLTNVAVVRYHPKGHKFEIACYKNKVQDWRGGVETDLNEVLQIYEIFKDVSKGEVAKNKDVKKYLHDNKDQAIAMILNNGDMQVSALERESGLDSLKNKIANLVSVMCVNKDTSVPFPVPIILKAMDDIKFSIKQNHDAKKQALLLIKQLPTVLPLERAKMRIKLVCSSKEKADEILEIMEKKYGKDGEEAKEQPIAILEKQYTVENSDEGAVNKSELVYLIMPHLIRDLTEMCNKDESITFEEIEHYVYSRLANQEEEKAAEKLYQDFIRQRENEENDTEASIVNKSEESKANMLMSSDLSKDKANKCSTCLDIQFETIEDFKNHCKSEWHIHNMKKKLKSEEAFTEQEYQLWKEDEIDREMFSKNKKGNKKKGKNKRRMQLNE